MNPIKIIKKFFRLVFGTYVLVQKTCPKASSKMHLIIWLCLFGVTVGLIVGFGFLLLKFPAIKALIGVF